MLFDLFLDIFTEAGMDPLPAKILSGTITGLIIASVCVLIFFAVIIIAKIITAKCKKPNMKLITEFSNKRGLPRKLAFFFVFTYLGSLAFSLPSVHGFIRNACSFIMIAILMLLVDTVLGIFGDFYGTRSISKRRPMKGILQIVKIVIYTILVLIAISILIDQSPLVLIGGIGTFTAILSIVFKDALLGLVAGVWITSDNLLAIGDWVEVPSEGVEGTVQDISLISVKILAFDNTLYTIPAYTFLSSSFRNWKTAIGGKARRARKTIPIDTNSLKILSGKDIGELTEKFDIKDLKEHLEDIRTTNGSVTNLSAYMYILKSEILKDPHILKDRLCLVQLGDDTPRAGLPVEFMFFTDLTEWASFSALTASKTELALTLARELDLKVFVSAVAVN